MRPEIQVKQRPKRDPLAMEQGNKGRLTPGGPVYEVVRVSEGAAYVQKVYDPPVLREIGREELDMALSVLGAVDLDRDDPNEAYRAACRAFRAARSYKRIEMARGPIEPGISRASRFAEEA